MLQPTILIADDDDAIRQVLTALLEEAGYRVLVARNGREAVEIGVAQVPDLALLDIMMPQMDGLSACRLLKSDSRTSHIPVLLLTALAQKSQIVEGLECGANDYITKPFEFNELLARLRTALAQKTQHDALAAQALTDPLTGLTNRRGLEQQLDQLLAHGKRSDEPLSLLMFDADRFKLVNDTYGHDVGDLVLAEISHCARESVRAQDTLGRFGGEEFVVILPAADRDAAIITAERLRRAVEAKSIDSPAGEIRVTISVGAATALPGHDVTRSLLVAAADNALYSAKRNGRNRVVHAVGEGPVTPELPEPPDAARALVEAIGLIHPPTASHLWAVSELCWRISGALDLFPAERSRIALAGLLHDVGVLSDVPALLTSLQASAGNGHYHTDREKQSEALLKGFASLAGAAPLVAMHRERWDGSGSAQGLHGQDIPLGSRIVAVADRYHSAVQLQQDPVVVLRSAAGTELDPHIVDVALQTIL